GEPIHIHWVVSRGKWPDLAELAPVGPRDAIQNLLRSLSRPGIPSFLTALGDRAIALPVRERIFESVQGRVDVGGRVASSLQPGRGAADALGRPAARYGRRIVGASGVFEKVLDLVHVVAELLGTRKGCAPGSILVQPGA